MVQLGDPKTVADTNADKLDWGNLHHRVSLGQNSFMLYCSSSFCICHLCIPLVGNLWGGNNINWKRATRGSFDFTSEELASKLDEYLHPLKCGKVGNITLSIAEEMKWQEWICAF